MAQKSKIEWTEMTWNCIVGCSILSPGCKNCYAMRQAHRHAHNPKMNGKYEGLTKVVNGHPVWNGTLRLDEAALLTPLRRKKPTIYFVNSMSDLFHEEVNWDWIDKVLAVAGLCPDHIFQILTKRPSIMKKYMEDYVRERGRKVWQEAVQIYEREELGKCGDIRDFDQIAYRGPAFEPLPNVWLGVSIEDQKRADERILALLDTPAALRFVSCEPLLGPVALDKITYYEDGQPNHYVNALTGEVFDDVNGTIDGCFEGPAPKLGWVIVGGESGPDARPMHPEWARDLRDQCVAAGIPFFFKQWGEFSPYDLTGIYNLPAGQNITKIAMNGAMREAHDWGGGNLSVKLGKRAAGRLLDGRYWSEMPMVTP